MAKKVTFKVGSDVYDIPVEQVDDFRKKAPNAIEVKSFVVDKDTFDIPLDKVDDFLSKATNAKPLYEEVAAPAPEKKNDEPQKGAGAGYGSGLTNKDLLSIALNEQKKVARDYPNWKESTWDDWYSRIAKQFNLSNDDVATLKTQRAPKAEPPAKGKDWTAGAGSIKKQDELKGLGEFTKRQQALAQGKMTRDAYAEDGAKVADDAYKRYKEQITQTSIDYYVTQRNIINEDPIKGYARYLQQANPERYKQLADKLMSGRWDKGADPIKAAELEQSLILGGPIAAGVAKSAYEFVAEMLQLPNTEDSGKLYKEALQWKGDTENAILKKLYADPDVKTYLKLNEELSKDPVANTFAELDSAYTQAAQTKEGQRFQELVEKGDAANGQLPEAEYDEYQQLLRTPSVQSMQQAQQAYQQLSQTPEGSAFLQKTQQVQAMSRSPKIKQFFDVNANADKTKELYEGYAQKYPQQTFEEAYIKAKRESTDAVYKRLNPFLKTMADMGTSLMRVPTTVLTEVAAGVIRPMAGAVEALGAEQQAMLWNDVSTAIVDLGNNLNSEIFPQPTNLEVPMYDNYVPYMGGRVYLNNRNEVVDVRDADGYAMPEEKAAQLAEAYRLDDNPPKAINSWNTHMILPRITQTAADLLVLAQAPAAGAAVGLGHTGSMVAYGYLTNYNAAYEEIKNADPFISEDAAHLYANTKGLVMGGLLTVTPQSIFKAGANPQQAWKEIGKEYTRILAGGATARSAMSTALSKTMLRDGAVMGGIGLAMDLSDRGIKLASNTLTNRPTLDTEYKLNQAVESGLSMFTVGAIMAGFGTGFRGQRMRGDALYTGLKNYERTIGEMEQMANRGEISQQDFARANGMLSQLKGVYDNLADMGKYNDAYKSQLIGLYAEKLRVEERLAKAASNTGLEIGYSPERVALQKQLDNVNRGIERMAIVNNPEFLVFTKKAEVEGDPRANKIIEKYVRGGGLTQAEVEYLASKTKVSKQYVIDPKTRRPMAVKEVVGKEPVEIEPGVEQMDILGVRLAIPEYFMEGEMVTRDQLLEMIKDPVFLSDVLSGRKMLDIFNDAEMEALLDRYRPELKNQSRERIGAGERMMGGGEASRPLLGPVSIQSIGSRSIKPKSGGPKGVVEQTETGWFFTDERGKSTQLMVRDKNNPVETIDQLGYELVEDTQPIEQASEAKVKVDIMMKDDNVSFIIGGEEVTWLKFNFGNNGELQTADVIGKDGKKHKIKNRDVVYDMAVMLSNNTSTRLSVPIERMSADIEQAVAPIKQGYDVGMRAIDNIFNNVDPVVEEALTMVEMGQELTPEIQQAAEAWLSKAIDQVIKIETDNVQEKENIIRWAGELWYNISNAPVVAAGPVQPSVTPEVAGREPVAEGKPSPAAEPREYEFPEVSTRVRGQAKRLAGAKGEQEVERIFETVREAYRQEQPPAEALAGLGYAKPEYQKAVAEISEALKPTVKEKVEKPVEVEPVEMEEVEPVEMEEAEPVKLSRSEAEGERLAEFNKGDIVFRDYDGKYEEFEILDTKGSVWKLRRVGTDYEVPFNAENNGGFILKTPAVEEPVKVKAEPEGLAEYKYTAEQTKLRNEINELKTTLRAGTFQGRKLTEKEKGFYQTRIASLEQKLSESLEGKPEKAGETEAIESWLGNSEYSEYISYEWDGNVLEISMGRDVPVVELSREELIEEGAELEGPKEIELPEPEAPMAAEGVQYIDGNPVTGTAEVGQYRPEFVQDEILQVGKETQVIMPDGTTYKAVYVLANMGKNGVLPSHNPKEGFRKTEGYPVDSKGNTTNDRDYQKDNTAQADVMRISNEPIYDLFVDLGQSVNTGPPVITKDGFVVAGNGRAMAISKFKPSQTVELRKAIQDAEQSFGFADVPTQGGNRFSVFRMLTDYDQQYSKGASANFNKAEGKAKSEADVSLTFGAGLSENARAKELLLNQIGEFDTMNQFFADNKAANYSRQVLLNSGLVLEKDINAFFTAEGEWTSVGKDVFRKGVFATLFDEDIVRIVDKAGVAGFVDKINKSLPAVARNLNLPSDKNLKSDIQDAIRFQEGFSASPFKDVVDYIRQMPLFDKPSLGGTLMWSLIDNSTAKRNMLRSALDKYNDSAEGDTQSLLFQDMQLRSKQDFFTLITQEIPENERKAIEVSLAANGLDPGRPGEVGEPGESYRPKQSGDAGLQGQFIAYNEPGPKYGLLGRGSNAPVERKREASEVVGRGIDGRKLLAFAKIHNMRPSGLFLFPLNELMAPIEDQVKEISPALTLKRLPAMLDKYGKPRPDYNNGRYVLELDGEFWNPKPWLQPLFQEAKGATTEAAAAQARQEEVKGQAATAADAPFTKEMQEYRQGQFDFPAEEPTRSYPMKGQSDVVYQSAREVLKKIKDSTGDNLTKKLIEAKLGRPLGQSEYGIKTSKPSLTKSFGMLDGKTKIKSPADVAYVARFMEDLSAEHAFLFIIDQAGNPIMVHIGVGGVASTIVNTQAVIDAALSFKAQSIYMIHNHPSGNMQASDADRDITRDLNDLTRAIGIKYEGSLIVDWDKSQFTFLDPETADYRYIGASYEMPKPDDIAQIPVYNSFYNTRNEQIKHVKIKDPESAMMYASGVIGALKAGEAPKGGVLLLDKSNGVVGHLILSGENDIETIVKGAGVMQAGAFITWGTFPDPVIPLGTDLGRSLKSFDHVYVRSNNFGKYDLASAATDFEMVFQPSANDIPGVEEVSLPYNDKSNKVQLAVQKSMVDGFLKFDEVMLNLYEEVFAGDVDKLRKNMELIKEAYDELSLSDDSWIDDVSTIDEVASFNLDKFIRGINSLQRKTDSLREKYNDFVSWFEYAFPDYVDYATIDIDPATGQAVIKIGNDMVKMQDGTPLYYSTWLNNKEIQAQWNSAGRAEFTQRPPMLWVDKDATPIPPDIVQSGKYNIAEDQRHPVNLALDRFINKGKRGMMIGDGPGVGKTREELVIAKEMAVKTGKPALIITAANNIVEQFKLEAAELSLSGISYRKNPKNPNEGNITIATYDDLINGKVGAADRYSVVIFDEAHYLKNTMTNRSKQSSKFLEKADHVVFATGTPMDKMRQFIYFLEYMSDKPLFQALDEVGLELRSSGVFLKKGSGLSSVKEAFINWRTNMIKEGGYIRREYPFFGNMSFLDIQMNEDDLVVLQDIADNKKISRRLKISEGNRYQEHLKANFIFSQTMKDLSEGKQVVVFCVGINPTEIKSIGIEVNQFAKEFADMLRAAKVPFAEIYGADASKKLEGARSFQRGEVKVAIATYGSGGTGIDLDDQYGDAPRVAYLATLPWSGTVLDQSLYRISRRNTKTPSRLRIVKFANSWVDEHKKDISDSRMQVLRQIQAGKDPDIISINNWKEDIDGRIVDVEDIDYTEDGQAIEDLQSGDTEEMFDAVPAAKPLTVEEIKQKEEEGDLDMLRAMNAAPQSTQKTINVAEVTPQTEGDPQELDKKKTSITSIGGSKEQPYQPTMKSRLAAAVFGPEDPKSLAARVLDIYKKLGVVTTGEYHMRKKSVLGTYSSLTRDVKLKISQDMFTAIHEAMHYGDKVVSGDLTEKILKTGGKVLFDELSEIADKFYPTKVTEPSTVISEGLAMFMEMSLFDPASVAQFTEVRKQIFTPGGQYYNPFFTKLYDEFNNLRNEVAAMAPLAQVGMRIATPPPKSDDYSIEGWRRIDDLIAKIYNEAYILEKWDDVARIGFGTEMERVVGPDERGAGIKLQSSSNAYYQWRKRNALAANWVSGTTSFTMGMFGGKPVYYGTDGKWKYGKYRLDDIVRELEAIEKRNPDMLNDSVWTDTPVSKHHTPEMHKAYSSYLIARRVFMDYQKRNDAELDMAMIIEEGRDAYEDLEVGDPDLHEQRLADFTKMYIKPLQEQLKLWNEVNEIIGNEGGSYKKPNRDFTGDIKAWLGIDKFSKPSTEPYSPTAGDLVSEANVTKVYDRFQPEFEGVDAMFDYVMQRMLIQAVATGMVSPKQANQWIADHRKYPGYAPFYRQMTSTILQDEEFQGLMNTDKSGKIRNTLRRMGSEKSIQDPLISAAIIIHENFRKGLRNLMWLRLANMAKTDPMLSRALTRLVTTRQPIKDASGATIGLKPVLAGKNPQLDNTVIIYSNGVPSFYGINDPALMNFYKAATELDGGQWWGGLVNSRLYKTGRGAATMFTLMTTGIYPFFAVQNFTVDQVATAINSRQGFIPVVSTAKHFLPALGASIGNLVHSQLAALDIFKRLFPNRMPNQAQLTLLQKYISLGGVEQTLINQLRNPESQDALLNLVDARPKGLVPKVKAGLRKDIPKGVDLAIDLAALPISLTEIATRFTEFAIAKKRGMTDEAAMRYAMETTPFPKRGNWKWGRFYFPLVSYMKTSVVVGGKALDELRARPKRYTMIWAGIASAVAFAMMNVWDELTEREKNDYRSADPTDLSMYFRFPARLMGGPDDVMWKFRIPENVGSAYALGTMYSVALRDNSSVAAKDVAKAMSANIPSVFSPYEWLAGDEEGVTPSILRQGVRVAPNIIRGPLGVYSDKITGREGTYPLTPRGLENLPLEQQFRIGKRPTAMVITKLGQSLNESMNLGLSPIQIEYLIGEYLGRSGRLMLDLMDEREIRSLFATPFEIKGTQNKWQERFYDNLTKLRRDYQFIDSIRDIRPPENTPELSKYLQDVRQTVDNYAVYEAVGTMMTKLRDAEDTAGIKGVKVPLYIYDLFNNALRSLYEEKPMYESIEKIDAAFEAFRNEAPAMGYEDDAFFYNYDKYSEKIAESQEVKYDNKTQSLFR